MPFEHMFNCILHQNLVFCMNHAFCRKLQVLCKEKNVNFSTKKFPKVKKTPLFLLRVKEIFESFCISPATMKEVKMYILIGGLALLLIPSMTLGRPGAEETLRKVNEEFIGSIGLGPTGQRTRRTARNLRRTFIEFWLLV